MDRRSFATFGACAFVSKSLPAQSQANPVSAGNRAPIAIASENLQWLRTPEDVAKAARDAGFSAVSLSVGPAPAHVTLGDAKALTNFVSGLRTEAIAVDTINCPSSLAAGTDGLPAFLEAAATAGIARYTFGPYPFATDQPIGPQAQDFKARLASLAKMNAHANIRGLYRNRAGFYHGAMIFDLLDALDDLDSGAIGISYDCGQGVLAGGGGSWIAPLRAAGRFLGTVICTDSVLQFQIDRDQGGPFKGTAEQLAADAPGAVAHPHDDGGGRTNRWIVSSVPLGTGLVDLPRLASSLKDIGFNGPLIVQSDYPNGGAENGGERLSLPRARVLGAIKRDLLALKAGLAAGGFV